MLSKVLMVKQTTKLYRIYENYKFTEICGTIPKIVKAVNKFNCDIGRVRILKQKPGVVTPIHIDEENWNNPPEKHLRVWIAVNYNPNFEITLGR